MLIIVALLVFYNEINTKMNIAEYILLAISLIAIITAAINYIQIDTIKEGFQSNNKNINKNKNINNINKNKNNKNNNNNNNNDTIIMNSEDSDEYLDSDEIALNNVNIQSNSFVNSIDIDNAKDENKKSDYAIKEINDLLGINNVSNFADIPTPTPTSTGYNDNDYSENETKSIFRPKVIISKKKGTSNSNNSDNSDNGFGSRGFNSKWNSAFLYDGFKFNDTMSPVKNLWRDEHGYYNGGQGGSQGENQEGDDSCKKPKITTHKGISGEQWTQNMDDYNKGKWSPNLYKRPSDYVDYTTSIGGYGTTTPDNFKDVNNKKCAEYNDLSEDQSGNLVIKDYKDSKKWVAGYTYVPPVNWDVPQRHTPVCKSATPNPRKLTGIIDRGLPINALELTEDGKIADTEDTVNLTNVGSMIPKFNYQEEPFSKPYV